MYIYSFSGESAGKMASMGSRILRTGSLCLSLALFACERTATFQPNPPDKAEFRIDHLGTYSSKLGGEDEKEIQGTIFQTTLSGTWEKQDGQFHLQRRLDTMIARGYHKASMPHELEKRISLETWLGPDLIPVRTKGYDSLKAIFSKVQPREDYRKQLLHASDTNAFKAWERDWWRTATFLPREKLEARTALKVDALNGKLETYKADSAHFDGPRPRLKKACLDFTVYYHRSDSLPLLMEQFFFSSVQNRKFRGQPWKPGRIQGFLQYSVERTTGLPCFHSRTEIADMVLEKKDDKPETPVQLYRYEEDIYQY